MPPYGGERHPAQQEAQENHPWARSLSVCRVPVQGRSARLSTTRPSIGSIWARGCASPRHCCLTRWTRVFPGTTATCPSHRTCACAGAHGLPRRPSSTWRPSCVMPSRMARTDAVDKALDLRPWGGPFDALASGCGRHAMCWERAGLACGCPALVGTTVQDPPKVPRALVADAQLTRGAQPQVSVPTPVGGGCLLGGSVGEAAATGTVAQG